MNTAQFTTARALAEFTTDETAEMRIASIAQATPDALKTLLRALRDEGKRPQNGTAWADLTEAVLWVYIARDGAEAMNARDDACEALMRLMERDYGDGCPASAFE